MNTIINKVENILTSEYSTDNFVEFTQEVFSNIELVAPDRFRKEFSNFSSYIEGATHIGNYIDPEGNQLVVAAVKLLNKGYVENSRSVQRNYAKKLIENAGSEAAFIAFYTEGEPKWRISFVRLDYEVKFEGGKLKTAENLTPAKRYSYLVGKDEPCHTAIDRFRIFIEDNKSAPALDQMEDVFSVEAVTNEFFKLYCEKFHQVREHLEANEDFIEEAKQHNFTSAQFAKKLMGQIVFLYFLQKKGWLGVNALPKTMTEQEYRKAYYARGAKSKSLLPIVYAQNPEDGFYYLIAKRLTNISEEDEAILAQCVKGQPWGTGPHNFMRRLFETAEKKNANFFDDYLEPLFYNALNVNRGEQGYDPTLHCRIPFLSGGLFEPIDGYEWEYNNFAIPNEIFSNRINNNARTGDGILDIFDRYNFTMSEDEPLEREVAIDPEMLGKVFENLLDVNDRKSKGAFYTPREIVHYMCQESLINYLTKEINVSESAVRDFILYGDYFKSEDTVKEKRTGNGDLYISDELYKLDSNGGVITNKLLEMDEALKAVRVADPTVGSGAFPLGMLNEIVRARQNISAYFAITMNDYQTRMMYAIERSPYRLKVETIKNCIYAADIEPSAVDIAQLRLWLSLVIDDELNPEADPDNPLEGHREPTPLPNLECNIICGNSLIDKFEGIELINQDELIGTADTDDQINVWARSFSSILPRLMDAQEKLFRCDDTIKKHELLKEIETLKDMIIYSQMEGVDKGIVERYKQSKLLASKPYVLWQLDFARVFKEKGGFDIVIGNPPYIQLQKSISETTDLKLGDLYINQNYETFAKTGDIYGLFYEKGWMLLHKDGVLAYITSNKWMRAGYGKALRGFFAEKTNPIQLIDFAGQKIFESATVDVNILMFEKGENKGQTLTCVPTEECRDNLSIYFQHESSVIPFMSKDSWIVLTPIEQSIKEKIDSQGTPLKDWGVSINYGIKTGYNDAFIITGSKKDELISEDPKSAEIIRPILRGRDIKRYCNSFADLWLINVHNGQKEKKIPPIDINDYPAIKKHLDQYYIKLAKRADKGVTPYNLRNCAYMDDFSKQKIIYPETTQGAYFVLDNGEYYLDKTCFFMISDNPHYLMATLSSKLFEYAYKHIYSSIELGTTAYQYNKHAFILLPIIEPSKVDSFLLKQIYDYVDGAMSEKTQQSKEEYIKKIDTIIYKLYGISAEEIMHIETS